MSLYQVQKLMFQLYNDLELRKRYLEAPEEVLERYELSGEEIEALRQVDAGKLYRMGAHTFLLWQFARIMKLDPAVYFQQIQGG